MKRLTIILFFLLAFGSFNARAQEQQVIPYTLADRDRAIRLEAKIEGLQLQIDQLSTLFYWGFGILITLFLFNLGYTIWDRRTALKPALDKTEILESQNKSLITALREYSKKHSDLADILKTHGLL